MGKTHNTAKFHRADLVICSHSKERKTPSYSKINTVATVQCIFINLSKFKGVWVQFHVFPQVFPKEKKHL